MLPCLPLAKQQALVAKAAKGTLSHNALAKALDGAATVRASCAVADCLHAITSFESGGVFAYACASSQVLMLFDQST